MGERSDFPEAPLEADANFRMVGKAREDGKLTVARQARDFIIRKLKVYYIRRRRRRGGSGYARDER